MSRVARPTYDVNWYTPSNLKAMLEAGGSLEKEVRKEYTRLRDISQKRLKRLAAAGYANTDVYQKNVKHYPKLKDIKTKSELAQRLSDLSRFVASRMSTVKGIKDTRTHRIRTLHEHGFTFVNDSNYADFAEFMESYRDQLLNIEYDSGDAAELFGVTVKHEIDPNKFKEDFEFWMENLETAKKLRKARKTTGNYEAFYDKAWDKVKASRKAK